MNTLSHVAYLKHSLASVSSIKKSDSSKRYLPSGTNCIGVTAGDIKNIITDFYEQHPNLSAQDALMLCEYMLKHAQYNEESLLGFGIINRFVAKHYNDDLLLRFEYWLEHYTNNWSLVDDLCIKTIFQFLMSRPHLIEQTQHWAYSDVSWCRRASNVVWVKFIKRKIKQHTYYLNKALVFKNCDLLINDNDPFVQKSVGWLLKVTAVEYKDDVIRYIEKNGTRMTRPTIRYAIEKMDVHTRKRLLAETRVNI